MKHDSSIYLFNITASGIVKKTTLTFICFIIYTVLFSQSTVTDIDGNSYKTVIIGTQAWMSENLKTTHYNDGTNIIYIQDRYVWANQYPGYGIYNDDSNN